MEICGSVLDRTVFEKTFMFSSRLPWHLRPNRLSVLLETKRRAGAAILDLTQSNPTLAGLNYPGEGILGASADPRSLRYEPSPSGMALAREAVAGYYAARGQEVGPDRIVLTASTSEAYSYLFKLLADPGDEILVPRPSYPLFAHLAELDAVRAVPYPLFYQSGWRVDFDKLRHAVSERTRAIVVVNPNNPTGSFLKREELATLVALCGEQDLAILSDEVFSDYAFAPDPERAESLSGVAEVPVFCLSGLSKVCGLPQMKVGWIAMGGPAASREDSRENLELIADTYLSVATPAQHALPRLLALGAGIRRQIQDRARQNLQFLRAALKNTACNALEVEGGWYAILQVPRTRSEEEWCLELLERDDLLVQPGYFYDFDAEAYLVLSLLTLPETFQEGLRRLLERVSREPGR